MSMNRVGFCEKQVLKYPIEVRFCTLMESEGLNV